MVESILDPSNVENSISMHKKHGPMPPLTGDMENIFDNVTRLCSFENELQNCDNALRIEDTLLKFYPAGSYGSSKLSDWAIVLASARLRKLGLKKAASRLVCSTNFSGYNFNQKGVNQ